MTTQEKIERLERVIARCADAYLQKVCRAEITALRKQLKKEQEQ